MIKTMSTKDVSVRFGYGASGKIPKVLQKAFNKYNIEPVSCHGGRNGTRFKKWSIEQIERLLTDHPELVRTNGSEPIPRSGLSHNELMVVLKENNALLRGLCLEMGEDPDLLIKTVLAEDPPEIEEEEGSEV